MFQWIFPWKKRIKNKISKVGLLLSLVYLRNEPHQNNRALISRIQTKEVFLELESQQESYNFLRSMVLNGKADESEVNSALELVDSRKGISCPGIPRVVSVVSSVLERAIQKNESLLQASKKKDVVTIFHGSRVPSLSIRQYIERIFKYSSCSHSCFVVAYIYIDRFLQQLNAYLTSLNAHRLLITSIMIASKFIDDE